jgi:hypothetical protein
VVTVEENRVVNGLNRSVNGWSGLNGFSLPLGERDKERGGDKAKWFNGLVVSEANLFNGLSVFF